MMHARRVSLAALVLVLAGCAGWPVSRGAIDDALAPPGADVDVTGIDPVIVGDRLLASGEAELALDSYIRAAGLGGLTPGLMRSMAQANLRLGRLGQAERLLRDALAVQDDDAALWNDLGVVLMERGDAAEARLAFRRAFALDSTTPQILENLRLSLDRLEQMRYSGEQETAFTLTRRRDGVFELSAAQ